MLKGATLIVMMESISMLARIYVLIVLKIVVRARMQILAKGVSQGSLH